MLQTTNEHIMITTATTTATPGDEVPKQGPLSPVPKFLLPSWQPSMPHEFRIHSNSAFHPPRFFYPNVLNSEAKDKDIGFRQRSVIHVVDIENPTMNNNNCSSSSSSNHNNNRSVSCNNNNNNELHSTKLDQFQNFQQLQFQYPLVFQHQYQSLPAVVPQIQPLHGQPTTQFDPFQVARNTLSKHVVVDSDPEDQVVPTISSLKSRVPPLTIDTRHGGLVESPEPTSVPSSADCSPPLPPLNKSRGPKSADSAKTAGQIIDAIISKAVNEPTTKTGPFPPVSPKSKKDGPWSEEEHKLFLRGVKEFGWGKWREIAAHYTKSRTRIQVATHAHKFLSKIKRNQYLQTRNQQIQIQIQMSEESLGH